MTPNQSSEALVFEIGESAVPPPCFTINGGQRAIRFSDGAWNQSSPPPCNLSLSLRMASALPPPGRSEILSLLRSLLRTGRQFSDNNIREYTKRRAIDGFRQNKDLSDPTAISAAYSDAKSQLEVVKRQSVVYSLYAPKVKNIMEIKLSVIF